MQKQQQRASLERRPPAVFSHACQSWWSGDSPDVELAATHIQVRIASFFDGNASKVHFEIFGRAFARIAVVIVAGIQVAGGFAVTCCAHTLCHIGCAVGVRVKLGLTGERVCAAIDGFKNVNDSRVAGAVE